MHTTYRLKADELDVQFIDALKAMYKSKEIEIVVCDTAEIEEDETEYLLDSAANRARLLKAIENVERRQNLVSVNPAELK